MTRFSSVWTQVARSLVLGSLVALVSAAVSITPANAQLEIELQALDPPEPSDKNPDPPPEFQAKIRGALPGLKAENFILKQVDLETPLAVPASRVTPYLKSNDKAAVVILIEGNGRWMGNETYAEEEGDTPEAGAFTGLAAAVDQFVKSGPSGSKAAVLLYGDGQAKERYEMGDASKLSGSVLGQQKEYADNLDVPLIVGLKAALNILDKHGGYRRILVVIGDGTGAREDISADLNARVEELRQRKIEVYTIFYEAIASGDPTGQANMKKLALTKHYTADSKDSIGTYAGSIVEELSSRYYVGFPGCSDGKEPTCFSHDGKVHSFTVSVQEEEQDEVELQTKLWEQPEPPEETSLWWLWLLLGMTGVGLAGYLVYKKLQSREVIIQSAQPEFEPEMAPAAPAKTMMFNIGGGGSGGYPIVGWIVPLTGPNQFQTFKLMQGVTIVGTGGNANILIQDGYMSTEHCQIVSSPIGFTLNDGGSTNGTLVNDSRVSSHELVDNDVLTMGQTNFKFKSIN